MQREIKFRAFDDGKMLYQNQTIMTDNIDQLWYFFKNVRKDAIIMQFTGLRDRNGKEIYENDILWFNFFYYGQTETEIKKLGIVKFIKGSFAFWVSEEEYYCFSELSFDSSMDIEIRGNVFDNPKMLLSDGSVK